MVGCVSLSGDVLDIPVRGITTRKMTVSNVQHKKLVGVVSFVFKYGHRKRLVEATDAFSSVVYSSADFPDSASDVRIAEDAIKEGTLAVKPKRFDVQGRPWTFCITAVSGAPSNLRFVGRL